MSLGIMVCNTRSTPKYRRVNAVSVIDLTMVKPSPINHQLVRGWKVLEDYTVSDHIYIKYTMIPPKAHRYTSGHVRASTAGWSVKKLNPEVVGISWDLVSAPSRLSATATSDCHADRLNHLLTTACDATMRQK
jgi:hypothetical protein